MRRPERQRKEYRTWQQCENRCIAAGSRLSYTLQDGQKGNPGFQNNNGRLGYRIELDHGDAVHEIALRFSGHDGIRLNTQGEIEVSTPVGQAIWTAPKAFWETDQGLTRAEATYAIGDDGSVGFEIEGPIRSDPLVIDPDLAFSTFLGGSAGDFITARDIADNGNIVVTGATTSLDFPLSANPAQGNNAGSGVCT